MRQAAIYAAAAGREDMACLSFISCGCSGCFSFYLFYTPVSFPSARVAVTAPHRTDLLCQKHKAVVENGTSATPAATLT